VLDPEAQAPVIQQQVGADLDGFEDLRMRQLGARGIARLVVEIEAEGPTGLQLHRAAGEGADPQLRPLQVHQDADRAFVFLLDLADEVIALLVIRVGSVAEIEAEDVGAGLEQRGNLFARRAGRPECGQDLGFALTSHRWLLPGACPYDRTRMARKSLTLVRVGPVTIRSPN
jgi:hypothetical protein